MKYKPIEMIAGSDAEFDRLPPAGGTARRNPPRKKREVEFKGLQIKIALVRDPDYSASVKVLIRHSDDVYDLLRPLRDEVVETFWVLVLNSAMRVLGVCEIARGQVDQVTVTPADILRPVLAAGAMRFAIAHNHPSGEPVPSRADKELTERVKRAAEVLGMQMLDHVIIGDGGHLSFAAQGIL